jgi:hypothetical protein
MTKIENAPTSFMEFYLKFPLVIVAALAANPSYADISCRLSLGDDYSASANEAELLIRNSSFKTEAVLITRFGTKVFNCVDAIVDEYECYGFAGRIGTPTQLNVIGHGMQTGTVVVHASLNLLFLQQYASDNYESSNLETRRFSIDTYTVERCE